MKRFLCLLCSLTLLVLAACQAQTEEPSASPTPEPTATVAPTPTPSPEPLPTSEATPTPEPTGFFHPLTGVPVEEDLSGRRPVAIMLNNIKAAMPQQGNGQADIIYEVLAEGGITRMLGVYLDVSEVELLGSVRSAREYFWELAQGHDAVFVHAGGSPEFYSNKAALDAFTVDGVQGPYSSAGAGVFWRDSHRVPGYTFGSVHSLVTSGEAITSVLEARHLWEHSEGHTYEMAFADNGAPADGQSANTVTASFAASKNTVFRYDGDSGLYLVEEFGAPYIDGNDGSQVAVTNVIILQTSCTLMDDYGRLAVDLSSGSGFFACGGKIVPITWKKGGRESQLRYYAADGQPLVLGRGKSYVCIIPLNRTVSAE